MTVAKFLEIMLLVNGSCNAVLKSLKRRQMEKQSKELKTETKKNKNLAMDKSPSPLLFIYM